MSLPSKKTWIFLSVILLLTITANNAFLVGKNRARQVTIVKRVSRSLASSGDSTGGPTSDNFGDSESPGIPQLPAIGGSSFCAESMQQAPSTVAATANSTDTSTAFVGHKFELQYTCKICDTRNSHRVSRIAYRNGVVIAICKGCDSQHLIADNLGWTDYEGGFQDDNTIEEFLATRGQAHDVNRVSPDVFHLEKLLEYDGKTIVSDDGNPAME